LKESLSKRIADSILTDYILSGRLKPGESLPSIRELQAIYRVSIATIQNSLSRLQDQGMVIARHGAGVYVTDSPAKQRPGKLIGHILLANAYKDELLNRAWHGVAKEAERHGYQVVLGDSEMSYARERELVRSLIDVGCEGLVINPSLRTRDELSNDYLAKEFRNFPIVLMDLAWPEQMRPRVEYDNYDAGYAMPRILIDEGHTHIILIDIDNADRTLMFRSMCDWRRGYFQAMKDADLDVRDEDIWVLPPDSTDSGRQILTEKLEAWWHQQDRSTACVAGGDGVAMTFFHVCRELGIPESEWMRVTGGDGIEATRSFYPQFDTTAPDFMKGGEIAARLLFELMDGSLKETVVYQLPVPIVGRKM